MTTQRNLSPQEMFIELAREHRPIYQFTATDEAGFQAWKAGALPAVLATLGESPPAADPEPELLAEWEDDGLICQRWIINVQRHLAAVLRINMPAGLQSGEQRPAILCCHGHGPFGKEPVMGNASSPELRQNIEKNNYNYGEVMARQGFITYAIDWIGFGERNDGHKPNPIRTLQERRDWCNIYYLHATMLGMTSLSINVAHGRAATDVMISQPHVDPDRLGIMGLSGGGTMALWLTLCDERFKATEIICYSDLFEDFGVRDNNYCGMQVAPGLFKLVNLPELQGLITPRPLLIDIGANDTCFLVDSAMQCFQRLAAIYQAANARERLTLDLHPGEHGWGGNHSAAFFKQHLNFA